MAGSIRHKAIALLARREHSCLEMRQKLKVRGFDDDSIKQTLAWLLEHQFLDESRFIESFIRMRSLQGHGPVRVRYDLRQRGIEESRLEASEQWQDTDWVDQARQVQARRFVHLPREYPEYVKQARFLSQRGFTAEQIKQVLGSEL